MIKVGADGRTFKVDTSEGEVSVSADRVRKCPFPQDLPEGMKLVDPSIVGCPEADSVEANGDEEETLDDMTEYVIERIVSHRRGTDGVMYLRVRWFGYDKNSDTWEPVLQIPKELVRRYLKRKKLDRVFQEILP